MAGAGSADGSYSIPIRHLIVTPAPWGAKVCMKTLGHIAAVLIWGFVVTPSALAEEPLVERRAGEWRYLDLPTAHPEAMRSGQWAAANFDDSGWSKGQAILGYGDADVATELSYGEQVQAKQSAALFRRRFRVADRKRFRLLRGRICCDDGAVVFVNGREVYRHNMPSGEITCSTRAVRTVGPDAGSERTFHSFAVAPDVLQDGENLVAVSVHQAIATSSDLAFDLELSALTTAEEVAAFEAERKAAMPTADAAARARLR
jgi:hypothetical protein